LSLLWIPDDRTGWIYPAVKRALKMMRDFEIRTVLTTSPPHSVQIIGLILKRILKKRWVVDLRDPWTLPLEGNKYYDARINRWLERKVVENADVVVVATEVVRKRYVESYPGRLADKFVCIANGYDLEDFKSVRKNRCNEADKFTTSYLGEFYIGRTPEILLQAVADLLKQGYIPREKLLMRFIGKVRNIGRKSLDDLVAELGLSSITEIIEPVPYHKAIEYMVSSDVLLVFSPQTFYQPTKVFEYMAAGAWVIAFTQPGALADLVRQYPKGMVVDYSDFEGAKRALRLCYDKYVEGKETEEEKEIEVEEFLKQYDRKNLTEKLSRYL
jgi:glycosyltransferase involved in cell wall biosynthesis